jgi:pimeloyl-ACP methyl ester carboxylesterase
MRYATVHPERVRSIILMGSGPPSLYAAQTAQISRAARIAVLQQEGIIPTKLSSVLDILPAYFSDPNFDMPEEIRNMHYTPAAEQLTWAALGEFDFTTAVAALEHRVLFLWGEDDPFGIEMADVTRSALSSAQVEFVVMRRCGHYWHECPEEFFSRVRTFLSASAGS